MTVSTEINAVWRKEFEVWAARKWLQSAWRHTSNCCGEWDAYQAGRQAGLEESNTAKATLATYRHHLIQLAIYADKAVGVLGTIEAENDEEEKKLQEIIDGIMTWGPNPLREAITDRWPVPEFLHK